VSEGDVALSSSFAPLAQLFSKSACAAGAELKRKSHDN
jgi:hypothetical protein